MNKIYIVLLGLFLSMNTNAMSLCKQYTLKRVDESRFALFQDNERYYFNRHYCYRINYHREEHNGLTMYAPLVIPACAPESEIIKLIYEAFQQKVIVTTGSAASIRLSQEMILNR